MSSYHGEKTAEIQNDLRRQTKRKQAKGTGTRRPEEKIDYREVAKSIPRYFKAALSQEYQDKLCKWANYNPVGTAPSEKVVTSGNFKSWFYFDGKFWKDDPNPLPLKLVLEGEEAYAANLEGTVILVTKTGFTMEDGSPTPLEMYGISFNLGGGLFGVMVKWDNETKKMFFC